VFYKICGIKNIDTLSCCIENKVDFFGMIFYEKSPRYINLEQAEKLLNYSQHKDIDPVGVFFNENIDIVKNIVKKLNLKIVQFHGNEDNNYLNKIKSYSEVKIIKSISVGEKEDLKKIDDYQSNDYFLLDYKPKKNELPGGNSKQFDWELLLGINFNKPWFISGGINIDNINKIKNYSNPDGIDLSSGVEEKPGIKSEQMINDFFGKIDV